MSGVFLAERWETHVLTHIHDPEFSTFFSSTSLEPNLSLLPSFYSIPECQRNLDDCAVHINLLCCLWKRCKDLWKLAEFRLSTNKLRNLIYVTVSLGAWKICCDLLGELPGFFHSLSNIWCFSSPHRNVSFFFFLVWTFSLCCPAANW